MKLKISDNVFSITEEINNYYKLNVSSSYANKVMQKFYKIFKLILFSRSAQADSDSNLISIYKQLFL